MTEDVKTAESGNGAPAPFAPSAPHSAPSGPYGGRRPRGGPGGRGRFQSRPKVCMFCVEKGLRVDYKQVDVLRRFVSESGKIRPRRQTGTCARHQRLLSVAVKRARHLALLPFTGGSSR